MKKIITLILLLCTMLLGLQARKNTATWQEVDTLIAQGHYTSAYEKGEQLFKEAKRKRDSHAMLKAVYKQRIAAAAYQENHIETSVKAYQDIIPTLRGADKAVAYMLLSTALADYEDRFFRSYATVELPPLTLCAAPSAGAPGPGTVRWAQAMGVGAVPVSPWSGTCLARPTGPVFSFPGSRVRRVRCPTVCICPPEGQGIP